MVGLALFAFFLFVGLVLTLHRMEELRDDARTWKRLYQGAQFGRIAMDDDMCRAFARELEIEADGGDNPAEFVRAVARQLSFSDGPSI